MVKAKANEITYMHFSVFDSDSVTPLTGQAGSCTSSLRKNGASTAEAVTIAEIGSTGRYHASFTPLAVSNYDLEVTCPDDRVIGEAWETETNDLDDLATDIATVDGNVDDILTDTNEIQGKLPTNDIADQTLIDTDLTNIETKIDTIDTNVDAILVDTGELQTNLERIMGLILENSVMEFTFTGNNQTSGGLWLYDTAINAGTHDKNTGKIGEYAFTATFSGSKPAVAKWVKVS